MQDFFICKVCGNDDYRKFGNKNGTIYCRTCLSYSGQKATILSHFPLNLPIKLDYSLTPEQERIAKEINNNYLSKTNSLVYAVCGAGKTELVYLAMQSALKRGHQIGFTVPRREVVIEIAIRIKDAFPRAKVISVFGDHTDVLTGNIIVLTTHQLFRYPKYFDLLIFDEIDAFPYKGDFVLEAMFKNSVKGVFVLLSATPSAKLLNEFPTVGKVLTLFTRFHNNKIPVPTISRGYYFFNFILLLKYVYYFRKRNKPLLIFVPTIAKANMIYKLLRLEYKDGNLVHSKVLNNSEIINDFKKGKYTYLVTTTVLERGVTIKGLQVIIYGADHTIYDSASLIQIAGRVGRKKEESDGEVIFIVTKKTKEVEEAIRDIETKNEYLQSVLQNKTS
ncbi:MAG: helicase-related protein [Bacilli bacterium]